MNHTDFWQGIKNKKWFEDGILNKECHYKNDLMDGPYTNFYESGEKIAPFKIKVPYGANNYLVKLEDWDSGRKIMAFFVNGRSISHALDVPTGTFRLKYASGQTWYGEKDLFGPNTSYNQANSRMTFEILGNRVSGHTVELIKQIGGNLRTSSLKPANF